MSIPTLMSPRNRNSRDTSIRASPIKGFTEADAISADPGSIVSGQNIWVHAGRLESRWGLNTISSNELGAIAVGSFDYNDVDGTQYQMAASSDTIVFFESGSWQSLVYASGASDDGLAGGTADDIFGSSIYLPRTDSNLAVFCNGVNAIYSWGGPSSGTAFSTLTQSPAATDLAIFNNRIVAWNVTTAGVRRPTGVVWSAAGDPEDWTGLGSGFEDLVDMQGEGTRIFTIGDELVLFTSEEIARGRRAAGTQAHQFSPLNREIGLPFKRASLQTDRGIFWLGRDYNIYHMGADKAPKPIGTAIQRTLRNTLKQPERAFFAYNPELQKITLHYTDATDTYPQLGFTLDLVSQVWTPQRFAHSLTRDVVLPGSFSVTSQWNQLQSTIAANTETWGDIEGRVGNKNYGLLTSQGSTLYYDRSATSDDANVVTSQAQFGGLFTSDPFNIKFTKQVRIDARADQASSITFTLSGDLGGSLDNSQSASLSVQSNSTQHQLWMGVSGQYHQFGLISEDLGWQFNSYTVTAESTGEAV